MTNFDFLRSMSVDELAEWLDENGQFDNSPWANWFNDKYCSNCESITCKIESANIGITPLYPEHEIDCAYCELENKCRFCPDAAGIPDIKTTIKMWLKEEANND